MKYKNGDITYIKINNKFIQVNIVKEVKWYHGRDYYVPGEISYFVQANREKIHKRPSNAYLESDIIEWEREFKLKELGI